MRMRVLIAACASDLIENRATPLLVAAIDYVIWEHIEVEAVDAFWAAARARVDPGGDYYEYREADVTLEDDDVLDAFMARDITGTFLLDEGYEIRSREARP